MRATSFVNVTSPAPAGACAVGVAQVRRDAHAAVRRAMRNLPNMGNSLRDKLLLLLSGVNDRSVGPMGPWVGRVGPTGGQRRPPRPAHGPIGPTHPGQPCGPIGPIPLSAP